MSDGELRDVSSEAQLSADRKHLINVQASADRSVSDKGSEDDEANRDEKNLSDDDNHGGDAVLSSTTIRANASTTSVKNAPATSSYLLPGRTDASRRRRQKLYMGTAVRGCPSDIDPDHHWQYAMLSGLQEFEQDLSVPLPPGANNFSERWYSKSEVEEKLDDLRREGQLYSSSAQTKFTSPSLGHSYFDEREKIPFWEKWKVAQNSDIDLQDVPLDMVMDVTYPAEGFFTEYRDDEGTYKWNTRYTEILNLPEGPSRTESITTFISEFSEVAVPLAVHILGSLRDMTSPILHKDGITIEVCGCMPHVKKLFSAPQKTAKACNREYQARKMLQGAAVPQLVIPFTLLVEHLGNKVIVYPRMPVGAAVDEHEREARRKKELTSGSHGASGIGGGSSKDDQSALDSFQEHRYGSQDGAKLVEHPPVCHDPEINGLVQRLARKLKCRGHWVGVEFSEKVFLNSPTEMQVFRSRKDNRLYVTRCARYTASTVGKEVESESDDDDWKSTSIDSSAASSVTGETKGIDPEAIRRVAAAHQTRIPRRVPNAYFFDVFRPEYVLSHQTQDLSSDCCAPFAIVNVERDEEDRLEETSNLLNYVLPQAADQFSRDVRLNGVSWEHMHNGGLSNFLHHWGINLRFLPQVHKKLSHSKFTGTSQNMVEVEIIARTLKKRFLEARWSAAEAGTSSSGEVFDASVEVLKVAAKPTPEQWKEILWPCVMEKYTEFEDESPWAYDRIEFGHVFIRFTFLVGARFSVQGTTMTPLAVVEASAPERSNIRVSFRPRVKCPPHPPAPFPDGQEFSSMKVAKRFLREAAVDIFAEAPKSKTIVNDYVLFLASLGEGHCEEINNYYIAEQDKKDRKGVYQQFSQNLDENTVKYRLKGGRGMRAFDVRMEATSHFRFHYKQRVQMTLGPLKGKITTIIGVMDGQLWKHDDNDDGAEEIIGRTYGEIQGNYGFVHLDRGAALLKRFFGLIKNVGGGIVDAFHFVNDKNMLILERNSQMMNALYSVSHGDRLQFTSGPHCGKLCTILGMTEGHLWYHFDGESRCEVFKEKKSNLHDDEHQDFAPTSHVDIIPWSFIMFSRKSVDEHLQYPIDTIASFGGYLDYFAGYKSCLGYGFFYRQVLRFKTGPYEGRKGVVVGIFHGKLAVLVQLEELPVVLGETQEEVVRLHKPTVVGMLSFDPAPKPLKPTLFYPMLNGESCTFDISCSSSEPYGTAPGQRIKLMQGFSCGRCGAVVGFRRGKLWAHFEGDIGAVPLSPGDFIVLNGSVFDRAFHLDPCFKRVRKEVHPTVRLPVLTFFGEVVDMDISPSLTQKFQLFHGQRVRIRRIPNLSYEIKEEEDQDHTTFVNVTVLGYFLEELWYRADGLPYAQPFNADDAWQILCRYEPTVVGLSLEAPFQDMFCSNNKRVCYHFHDRYVSKEHIQLFNTTHDEVIGVDVRDASIRSVWKLWKHDTTIVRQDRIHTENIGGKMIHKAEGPRAIVMGIIRNVVYVLRKGENNMVVYPLLRQELPKWLPCDDWRLKEGKPFVTVLPAIHSLAERINIIPRENEVEKKVWCYQHADTGFIHIFPRDIAIVLEQLAISEKDGKKYYDLNGGGYDAESMEYVDNDAKKHVMRCDNGVTVQSYSEYYYRINLKEIAPRVLTALETLTRALIQEKLQRTKVTTVEEVFCTQEATGCRVIFMRDELPLVREACASCADMVTEDLLNAVGEIPQQEVHEMELRYVLFNSRSQSHAMRYALEVCGVFVPSRLKRKALAAVLCAIERRRKSSTDAPLNIELAAHFGSQLEVLVEKEREERLNIFRVETKWWQRNSPFTYENSILKHVNALRAMEAPEIIPTSRQMTLAETAEETAFFASRRFVLRDGTVIVFQPSSWSLKRGDIVRYTHGDVAGIEATILGEFAGQIWRYEHSGHHANKALAFQDAPEEEVIRLYGIEVVRSIEELPREVQQQLSKKILRADTLTACTWEGTLADFNIEYDALRKFDVLCGERYISTSDTPSSFPYHGKIIVILGVRDDKLWFAVDQSGAIPFPREIPMSTMSLSSDAPRLLEEPVSYYKLRLVCTAPVEPAEVDPKYAFRFYGTLNKVEGEWLDEIRPTPLVFNIHPSVLDRHGANHQQRMLCTHGDLKGKRITVIGVRHGTLWVVREGDSAARELSLPLQGYGAKSLLIEGVVREFSLPLPRKVSSGDYHFRFRSHTDTLALFDVSSRVYNKFGFNSGDMVVYKMEANAASRCAVIVGIRQELLWRMEEGDDFAKPLIGFADRHNLVTKLGMKAVDSRILQSHTW